MKSFLTDEFFRCYRDIPESIRKEARVAYKLWNNDPHHPSLHFKRVHERDPIYSVRVARNWRVVGIKTSDTMAWFWIGSHDSYERLLMNL